MNVSVRLLSSAVSVSQRRIYLYAKAVVCQTLASYGSETVRYSTKLQRQILQTIAELFYARENTRFCSWKARHRQKMDFSADFRKHFFSTTSGMIRRQLNLIRLPLRCLKSLHNISIMHKSEMLHFWSLTVTISSRTYFM